jgi:DNA-cytosine methyltransferase
MDGSPGILAAEGDGTPNRVAENPANLLDRRIRYIEMFGGVGGFRLGLEGIHNDKRQPYDEWASRFRCVGYYDIDKYAVRTYNRNFGTAHKPQDVREIAAEDFPDHELLTAGFPCQAFSVAGHRKGFDDTRGTLFFEVARVMDAKRPRLVLLENVKGLMSHDGGKTIDRIIEVINSLGYVPQMELENSKDHGVPQNRERVFIICYNLSTAVSDGNPSRMRSLKPIIEGWLFTNLLKNLGEVKGLQGSASKDLVCSLIVLTELARGLNQKMTFSEPTLQWLTKNWPSLLTEPSPQSAIVNGGSDSPSDGISKDITSILVDIENAGLENAMWSSIDSLLKAYWEENSSPQRSYTTSTVISWIIDQRIFTSSQLTASISWLTLQLRSCYPDLWNEILSDLIVIQDGTNYAKAVDKDGNANAGWSNGTGLASLDEARQKDFIAQYSGKQSRPEVFPLREDAGEVPGVDGGEGGQVAACLTTGVGNKYYRPNNIERGEGCLVAESDGCGGGDPAVSNCLTARYEGYHNPRDVDRHKGCLVMEPEKKVLGNISPTDHLTQDVLDPSGISPTLRASTKGRPPIVVSVQTPNRDQKAQNGTRFKEDGIAHCLTVDEPPGIMVVGNLYDNGHDSQEGRVYDPEGLAPVMKAHGGNKAPTIWARNQRGELRSMDVAGAIPAQPGGANQVNFLKEGAVLRKLTPRECARLQGFPEWFAFPVSDSQIYRQMGNTVTVNVIHDIGVYLLDYLSQDAGEVLL